ncbi:MAG: cysteine desulfurase family protein, partial [Minisyncoccia bacterium]
IFTSGATEANSMVIFGVVRYARASGVLRPHIIVSSIEHPSVLEVAKALEAEGVLVDYVPVDSHGLVDTKELRKLIRPETVLVSIMYANNEIGTIEPIIDIAKEIRHARKMNGGVYPYFHTDAAQAGNYLDINVLRLGVDLMTLSSGKTYGPRGVGALFVKRGVEMSPLMYGGEHENGRRAGTEAVALTVGFATALKESQKMIAKESNRVQKLRDSLASKILKKVSGTSVNGDLLQSLPNILNISFDGVESEALVLYLDAVGIAVSGRSACKSSDGGPSHVILAIGEANEGESGSIRFSLGRETKNEDITRVASEVSRLVPLLRKAQVQSDRV